MIGMGVSELIIVFFIISLGVLPTIAIWKIASKAGLSPWISLTQLIPPLNLIGLFYIAFTKWPNSKEE